MNWHDAMELVRKYVVKIETSQGYGSGCIMANIEENDIGIATAAHVVDNCANWRQPIMIQQNNGQKIFLECEKGYKCSINSAHDLALIKVNKKNIVMPEKLLTVLPANNRKRDGVEIGWCGYPAIAPLNLCFFCGHISSYLGLEFDLSGGNLTFCV